MNRIRQDIGEEESNEKQVTEGRGLHDDKMNRGEGVRGCGREVQVMPVGERGGGERMSSKVISVQGKRWCSSVESSM